MLPRILPFISVTENTHVPQHTRAMGVVQTRTNYSTGRWEDLNRRGRTETNQLLKKKKDSNKTTNSIFKRNRFFFVEEIFCPTQLDSSVSCICRVLRLVKSFRLLSFFVLFFIYSQ